MRQRTSACVITNIYHFQCQNPSEILFEDIFDDLYIGIIILEISYL